MASISSLLRRVSVRHLRASHPPIERRCVSTVANDGMLFQQIQPHIFPPISKVPDLKEFPFHFEGYDPIILRRNYGLEQIALQVDKVQYKNLKMTGIIGNEHAQFMKFRMDVVLPDYICFEIIMIRDERRRHVMGSTEYLETKGIKLSTVSVLFDYLKTRVPPSQEDFPFELKNGPEKGTLALRRKCEDEIVIVEVKAIGEDRILAELADLEAYDIVRPLKDSLNWHYVYYVDDFMAIFDEDEYEENEEKVEDIGCLLMTVRVYYGDRYLKCIKLTVFAFPERIDVPEIILTDRSFEGFKTFETYFKDRGIHTGTLNTLMDYYRAPRSGQVSKAFGRFEPSQIEEAKERLRARR